MLTPLGTPRRRSWRTTWTASNATTAKTVLYVVIDLDGTIADPGYGVLGRAPHRCRPVRELVERTTTDVATASDTDGR